MLMTVLLAAHLTCVCAGPAHATVMTIGASARTADPHACCRRDGAAPAPSERQGRVCQHCTGAQLTAPDAVRLADPIVHAIAVHPPTAMAPIAHLAGRRLTTGVLTGHPPPLVQRRTRVLLL